ncbi:MAG: phosphoenolpyruvate carboxykinase [Bdellovibrionales bacterium]|nr:phosphoenolpyruvate carboxykinase [Bdellovibrionales bacterium]
MLELDPKQARKAVTSKSKTFESEFTVVPSAHEVIRGSVREELRAMAKGDEKTTEYGSASYVAKFKSRSAAFTRTTVDKQVTEEDRKILKQIQEYLKKQTVIEVDRQMCQGPSEEAFVCRLWVTKPYARLAHMFHASLGPVQGKFEHPDLFVVDVPEFSSAERRILVDADAGVTYVLGSDYYGEIKKAFLRMVMYRAKQQGGLGLHAGSKEVWAKSHKTGKIERSGILFFGLSGTGKTSLTCHDYSLDASQGEKCRVRQDDVVILNKDGSARGTEIEGFYIKTEGLNPTDQGALYGAAISPETIFENVYVAPDGKVDFYNDSIAKNGRAVAPVRQVLNTDGDIDMPQANQIFFITRNPMTPPVARLTREQAALAFMLGESIKTSAADPKAKGEPVREVGTNPFIVGSKDFEGNRFFEILDNNPQMECFLLNTGKVGEAEKSRKISILETIAILRAVAREGITWKKDDILNLETPEHIEGMDISDFNFSHFWSESELTEKLLSLREERRAWLEKFPQLHGNFMKALY